MIIEHLQTIATASMFLACKIEETPRLLRDVVVVAYEMIYKWDPSAPQRIRRIVSSHKNASLRFYVMLLFAFMLANPIPCCTRNFVIIRRN